MIFYELVKLSKDIIHLANSRGDTWFVLFFIIRK